MGTTTTGLLGALQGQQPPSLLPADVAGTGNAPSLLGGLADPNSTPLVLGGPAGAGQAAGGLQPYSIYTPPAPAPDSAALLDMNKLPRLASPVPDIRPTPRPDSTSLPLGNTNYAHNACFNKLGQPGEMELGESGGSYGTYGTPLNGGGQYGTAKAMQVISAASGALANADRYTPLDIGNMSLELGGPFSPHKGHSDGLEIDVRPNRIDQANLPVTWKSPQYDRAATQRIVDAFRATGQVSKIFFNDPNIVGVTPLARHDDHLHVQVKP